MIDFTQKKEYKDWLGDQFGYNYEGEYTTIANLDRHGNILCVVLYAHWLESGCEMVIASTGPRWATKDFMYAAFAYPFIQAGKARVTFIVEDNNLKCLKLCHKLGARVEGKVRKWFGENDGIVFGLLKEECKYIKETAVSAIPPKERLYG